jgi:hypothetical protein
MSATDIPAAGGSTIAAPPGSSVPRPYAPSWLNLVIDWLDRLPGPRVVAYGILALVFVVLSNSALWVSGLLTLWTLDPAQTFWGFYLPALLATVHYLDGVAGRAFGTYRPVLGPEAEAADRLRYELTVIPALPAAALSLAVVPLTFGYYLVDPVGSQVVGYAPGALILRGIGESITSAIVLVLVYHTLRRLRVITHLHAMAHEVDVFQPRPLHAFSQVTSQTAVALIAFITVPVLLVQPALSSPNFWLIWAPWLIGIPVAAIAVFVIPMIGMHRRLAAQKDELRAAADERLRTLLADLNAAVDARELSGADGLQKLLAAHQAQRELLAHLPTWPWTGTTLRGFASALLLPVVLFLIQRLLAEVLPS